jgi:hypothetical protein
VSPWVKLDDSFPDHPKVLKAGDQAAWMFVCGLLYSARALTDGFIPIDAVRRLTHLKNPMRFAQKLVEVRLWELAEGGFTIHDYAKYQRSRQQIEAERERNAKRSRRWRDKERDGTVTPLRGRDDDVA